MFSSLILLYPPFKANQNLSYVHTISNTIVNIRLYPSILPRENLESTYYRVCRIYRHARGTGPFKQRLNSYWAR